MTEQAHEIPPLQPWAVVVVVSSPESKNNGNEKNNWKLTIKWQLNAIAVVHIELFNYHEESGECSRIVRSLPWGLFSDH